MYRYKNKVLFLFSKQNSFNNIRRKRFKNNVFHIIDKYNMFDAITSRI